MHIEQKKKNQSLLSGAFFLMITTAIVHIIGVLYKIPLTTLIGPVGRGYFTSAYEIYTPIYAISMAGLPVAVSKMVSESISQGKYAQVIRLFGKYFWLPALSVPQYFWLLHIHIRILNSSLTRRMRCRL